MTGSSIRRTAVALALWCVLVAAIGLVVMRPTPSTAHLACATPKVQLFGGPVMTVVPCDGGTGHICQDPFVSQPPFGGAGVKVCIVQPLP
jgi:hypothetical protein